MSATDAKTDVDTLSVDTSRGLCLDGVQQCARLPGTPDRLAGLARRQQVAAAGG